MRIAWFIRCSVALGIALLIFSIASHRGGETLHAQVPAKTQEKTAEQVKKNIQVLKGLPASQLDLVMDYMATSLGVQCVHCHVIDESGWYMDKDDKQTKHTARKMMQMVMDLNTKSFGGRNAVSCYTCHRGSTEPTKLIPLPQPQAIERGSEEAQIMPDAGELLSKYENAIGGSAALKKVTSRMSKGVSVDMQGKEMPLEIAQQGPDQYVETMTMREGAERTVGYNGDKGWMNSPRGGRMLSPGEVEELKNEAAFFPTETLRKLSKSLSVIGAENVNGSTAYILTAPIDEHATERFYIDSTNGLLVRKSTVTETMIGNIPEQIDYSDYRSVDGVKVPFVVKTSAVDPHDASTHRFSSIQQNVSIDKKKFAMPEIKPRSR